MAEVVGHIPSKKQRKAGGFTLLEVLISLTILGLTLVLVLSALRLGTHSWEKGEQAASEQQRYRIALNRIKNQLASVVVKSTPLSDRSINERTYLFSGTEKSITFISNLPLFSTQNQGRVFVKYAIGGPSGDRNFLFFEKSLPMVDFNETDRRLNTEADEFSVILDHVSDASFDYMKPKMSEGRIYWQQTWNNEVEKGFPGAVRIRFQPLPGDEYVTIIVPFHHKGQNIG